MRFRVLLYSLPYTTQFVASPRMQGGTTSSCYRVAEWLCRCNLNASGCGSSRYALQQCIDKTKKLVEQMKWSGHRAPRELDFICC